MDIIMRTACIIFACCQFWQLADGGSCWWDVHFKTIANTSTLLATNVTRQQCCQLAPVGEKFYSDDDEPMTDKEKLRWRYRKLHKCTMACRDGCSTFSDRCSDTEVCRVKPNGLPKCICNPYCSKHQLSQKGKVCGSDGKTYSHHCQLLRYKCRRKKYSIYGNYYGECQTHSCKNVKCVNKEATCITDQYNRPNCIERRQSCTSKKPICGNDGKTYQSVCHMVQHNLKTGLSIKVSYYGHCSDSGSCLKDQRCSNCFYDHTTDSHICDIYPKPDCANMNKLTVCGSDGVTYENECLLRKRKFETGTYITVEHVAACNATREEILAVGRRINDPTVSSTDEDDIFRFMAANENRKFTRRSNKRGVKRQFLLI